MKLLNKNSMDLSFLKNEFSEIEFEFFELENDSFMSCLGCWCVNAEKVIESWDAIQSLFVAYYHPEIEIIKWNTYLVFFCAERLKEEDKYLIENNKFFFRKVILDNMGELPDLNLAEKLINMELLGTDIVLKGNEDLVAHGLKLDASLWSLIEGTPDDNSAKSREQRDEIIKNIIRYINNEN